jgi:ABC-type polysaccharide/polyol phosphate export permease
VTGLAAGAPRRSRRRQLGYLTDVAAHLVRVELATRHRGSALGWLWALGPPLLQLGATYLVFTRVLPLNVPNYPVFLLVGILGWTIFARSVGAGVSSLEQRRELVFRPGFRLELLPISAVLVAFVDYLLALPVLVVALALTTGVHATWGLVPAVLAVQLVLCAGLALLLAPLQVYLRDVRQLVGIGIAVGFWLTPVFYRRAQVPDEIDWVYDVNPLQYLLEAQRELLIGGTRPEALPLVLVGVASLAIFAAGYAVLARLRNSIPEQL